MSTKTEIPKSNITDGETPSSPQHQHKTKRPRLNATKIDIPSSRHYHVSYAHRSIVTFTIYIPKHDMVLTASQDGIVKFWKRTPLSTSSSSSSNPNNLLEGDTKNSAFKNKTTEDDPTSKTGTCLEFVKSYVAHTEAPVGLVRSQPDGDTAASIGADNRIKFYDVGGFDVKGMIEVDGRSGSGGFRCGGCSAFVGEEQSLLAVSSSSSGGVGTGDVYIFSSLTLSPKPVRIITLHAAPITAMKYNYIHHCMISADSKGILEYWNGSIVNASTTNANNADTEYSNMPLTDYDTIDSTTNDNDNNEQSPKNNTNNDDNNTEQQEANTSAHAQIGSPATYSLNHVTFTADSKISTTDLYTLLRKKTYAISLDISPDGSHFVVYGSDRKVRLFHYRSGNVKVQYDERMEVYDKLVQMRRMVSGGGGGANMDAIDYGKRAATERELAETTVMTALVPSSNSNNAMMQLQHQECGNQSLTVQFDPTGNYLLLPTILGIKVIEWATNKCRRIIGRADAAGLRFLGGCLCPGDAKVDRQMALARSGGSSVAMGSSGSNAADKGGGPMSDALFITTAYKQRRLYIFSHLDPIADTEEAATTSEGTNTKTTDSSGMGQQEIIMARDILNEPPDASDMLLNNHLNQHNNGTHNQNNDPILGSEAILRTTMGDIHIKLFPEETPRSCENFCGHARSGYYDNVIFHRVIKGFMIQTGDPLGDGTGGESIWGGEFEDEFVRDLRHDRTFTVSMANAGPATNGSQFFITTVPTPWLDNKHTVFGRVTRGMDICSLIENVKVDEMDKPYDEITIASIDIL